jgi:hypothetical protein
MGGKHLGKAKRFKGGRLSNGSIAVRIMEEDGDFWRNNCTVIKVTKKFIICEIKMASTEKKGNKLQQVIFDRKTGVHLKGREFGWLENPPKPKNKNEIHVEIHNEKEPCPDASAG